MTNHNLKWSEVWHYIVTEFWRSKWCDLIAQDTPYGCGTLDWLIQPVEGKVVFSVKELTTRRTVQVIHVSNKIEGFSPEIETGWDADNKTAYLKVWTQLKDDQIDQTMYLIDRWLVRDLPDHVKLHKS